MSRTEYLKSLGYTCKNYRKAWSWVNHEEEMVCIEAWDHRYSEEKGGYLVLRGSWRSSSPDFENTLANVLLHINEKYRAYLLMQTAIDPDADQMEIKEWDKNLLEVDVKFDKDGFYAWLKQVEDKQQ